MERVAIVKFDETAIIEEKRRLGGVWNYSYFREYLLALARDESSLKTTENYAYGLKLSEDWHELLNRMRIESEDLVERFSVIGADKYGRRLVLQVIPAVGEEDHVSTDIQEVQIEKAKRQAGVDVFSDIHSHPEKLGGEYDLGGDEHNHSADFSPGDFYCMVGKNHLLVMGLVQGNENLFAFRTRESEAEDELDYLPFTLHKRSSFNKYWWGKSRSIGLRGLRKYESDPRKVNFDIARKHKLVMYKGRPEEDLVRIFP